MRDFIKYFLIGIISLWLLGFIYIFSNSSNNVNTQVKNNYNENEAQFLLLRRVKKAEDDLVELQLRNKENELVIKNLREQSENYVKRLAESKKQLEQYEINSNNLIKPIDSNQYPSINFEDTRRKIFEDIKDVSYYVNSQIDSILSQKPNEIIRPKIVNLKNNFKDRISVLIAEMYNLSTSDNYGEWRRTESLNLANKLQKEFLELQNPENCETSKKIICDLNKSCGFGCQMHHVMYCFITAYFTKRTMILESNGWRYNNAGFETYFKPVSDTCKISDEKAAGWNEQSLHSDANAIRMPIIDVITGKPRFLPLSIPKQYANIISKFHGNPFVWWGGQVLSYLMRYNSNFEEKIKKTRENLKFQTPCVGVHVRRTDKVGTEAAFHGLDEYMKYVKEFFDIYDYKNSRKSIRTVYLATDEVSVLKEAQSNYKDYVFLMDETIAKSASLSQRYSPDSAQGVILDIHFLSQCDYLVCTFSSQVCRMAYELMQVRYPDASWRFRSLDDVYYFGGQNGHNVKAIYDHIPNRDLGEIELKKGDLIGLAGNHWDGYSKGRNLRTNEEGLFPSYKVVDVIVSF